MNVTPRVVGRLWTIRKNHPNFGCELVHHGVYGVEAQILRDVDLMIGRHFETEAQAEESAEDGRKALQT